ncbi:MAG: penicillin-binding transpeptidase domain-containing protein, partial [Clostridia bacterium]
IAVTPIQLAGAVSSVVNGGVYNTPHIVNNISGDNLSFCFEESNNKQTITKSTSDTLKNYLYGVVEKGGGKNAKIDGYKIVGKTAQKYENGAIARGKYISSFLGFTDVGDDTLVCLLLVDEPQGYVYYGSIVAAPFVKQIFGDIFVYKNVKPTFDDNYKPDADIVMPNLVDLTTTQAASMLKGLGLQFELSGENGIIVNQFPAPNSTIKSNTVVFISTENN